ncbi:MAG: O-antigen ligase family protein [Thermoleophilia bacterium]
MTGVELTRAAGAVATAVGVAALLLPVPRVSPTLRRAAGLVLTMVAWAVLTVTLAPSITSRLTHPAVAGAVLVAAVVGLGLVWLGGRAVVRWPTAWFVALAVTLPVRIPVPLGGDDHNLLLPLYAVIFAGVAGLVWERLRGRMDARWEPSTSLDLPLGIFLTFALASAAWSVDGKEATVKIVFFYVPFLLLYLTVVAWWPRARAVPALTLTTIALAVPVALLALVQYATGHILWNVRLEQSNKYSSFFRANSIFWDPNILGRFLVVGILAVTALVWLRPYRREAVAAAAVLVVLLGGLAVSFSRSSCLMLMTGLALLAWRAFGGRRTVAVGGITLLLLGGVAVASSHNVRRALTSPHRMSKVSEGRFDLIRGGVHIWERAPVHGAGLGGFQKRYQQSLTPSEQRRVRVVISHNTPITVLSELGAVGFGLFVWLCLRVWRDIRGAARRVGGEAGWEMWVMLAVVTGILVHALFYAGFFEDPYLWTLTAGALALGATAGSQAREPEPGG